MSMWSAVKKAFSTSSSRLFVWRMPRSHFNYAREVGSGLQSSVLTATVFWIMRRFAESKIIIERDDEEEIEHPLLDLLAKPNPFYGGRAMRMGLALSYVMDGNAYLIKVRDRQLRPVQLWYVPHWFMEPHWPEADDTVFVDYYSYYVNGREIKVPVEDVVHVRFGVDPVNVRKGLAALKALYREVFTDDEAANFTAALLRNFGVPGLLISPDSDDAIVDDATPKEVKAFFRERFSGDNRGEPLVMKSKTRVEQFGFDPKALDLGRLRQIPEERVTAVLGVPAAVVGFGTGLEQTKVGATMKELRESAYEDCIIPMQNAFADEYDRALMVEFEPDTKGVHVAYDVSDVRVLQEDENKKAERVTGLVAGTLITVAEARRELGYEVKPEHEVYLQKVNVFLVPDLTTEAEPEPVNPGQGPEPPIPPDETPAQPQPKNGHRLSGRLVLPSGLKADFRRLAVALLRSWLTLSSGWEKELVREFTRLGADVRRAFESIKSLNVETKVDADEALADEVSRQIAPDAYVKYQPHYLRVAEATFQTIQELTDLGVNLSDEVAQGIIARGGTRRGLIDLRRQVKDAVYKALKEGRAIGEGPAQLAKRIEDLAGAGPWSTKEIRARVISRTETKYAQNVSSIRAYETTPGITAVQVIDAQLGETDEECMTLDGQVVTFEEADVLANEEHANGTRSFTPIAGGV